MENIPVSVLVPVYNAASTVDACLASLAAQTLERWEAVLVDDGSTDGTPDILAARARHDGRFRVVSRPHAGLVPALNAGLAACRAPLIARLDADDVAHPDRLRLQRNAMASDAGLDLLACQYDILSHAPPAQGSVAYRDWQNALLTDADIRRNLFVESPFAHPTVVFRAGTVARVGGYRDAGWAEDYDLWLRLARHGARFAKLPEPLVQWRDQPGRLTWTDPRYSLDAFARCKAHHLARGPLNNAGPVVIAGAGIAGGRIGRAVRAEGVEVAAYIDVDPRKVGGTKRGRPVLAWDDGLERLRGRMVLVAVGARGGRDTVRALLDGRGLAESRDYLCVA